MSSPVVLPRSSLKPNRYVVSPLDIGRGVFIFIYVTCFALAIADFQIENRRRGGRRTSTRSSCRARSGGRLDASLIEFWFCFASKS
jgi:hypothetical protein